MSVLQTLVAGGVAIGMLTAVLLPGRQTVGVLKAFTSLITGTLRTSISGK